MKLRRTDKLALAVLVTGAVLAVIPATAALGQVVTSAGLLGCVLTFLYGDD